MHYIPNLAFQLGDASSVWKLPGMRNMPAFQPVKDVVTTLPVILNLPQVSLGGYLFLR